MIPQLVLYLFAGFGIWVFVGGIVAPIVGRAIDNHLDDELDGELIELGRVHPPTPRAELRAHIDRLHRQAYTDRHICERLERENGLV